MSGGGSEDAGHTRAEQRQLARWQGKLLPVMVVLLLGAACFFFYSTFSEYQRIERRLAQASGEGTIAETIRTFEKQPDFRADLGYLNWKVSVLENDRAATVRNQRANSTLLVSVWTRNLGFVTGMVLALVGASFIMAKLSEGTTTLDGSGGGAKVSLATSSPGIVLAVLGTALMMMAISVRYRADLGETVASAPAPGAAPGSADSDEAALNPPAPPFPKDAGAPPPAKTPPKD